jgi:hypothetical protein
MPRKPSVRKLPEPERREMLGQFLAVLDQSPDLAYFRAVVRTGPERQLALLAAFERSVVVGSPAASPPNPDDECDVLLCDVLDMIDRDPELKRHGSAYGPDRHLVNLQALGLWRGPAPASQPTASELFATSFSHLTTEAASSLPSSETNNSPAPQDFSPSGELFGPSLSAVAPESESPPLPQVVDATQVTASGQASFTPPAASDSRGVIRHPTEKSGEQFEDLPADPRLIPARPVRRGRPVALDDTAKGRLLGLMSYGLSFRQAAAQLGVHHQTLLNTLKRDEEFTQQVSEARLDAISQPLLTVVQASRTSWRAAAWLAKFLDERRTRIYETTPEEREVERGKRS